MGLRDIFTTTPKWKSNDPAKRLKGLKEVKEEGIFLDIARNDPNPFVRIAAKEHVQSALSRNEFRANDDELDIPDIEKEENPEFIKIAALHCESRYLRYAAVHKSKDQKLLEQIARSDEDKFVRSAATRMLKTSEAIHNVLRSDKEPDVRIVALEKTEDTRAIEQALLNDTSTDVRKAAIWRVTNADVLKEVEKNDPDKELRSIAKKQLKEFQSTIVIEEAPVVEEPEEIEAQPEKTEGSDDETISLLAMADELDNTRPFEEEVQETVVETPVVEEQVEETVAIEEPPLVAEPIPVTAETDDESDDSDTIEDFLKEEEPHVAGKEDPVSGRQVISIHDITDKSHLYELALNHSNMEVRTIAISKLKSVRLLNDLTEWLTDESLKTKVNEQLAKIEGKPVVSSPEEPSEPVATETPSTMTFIGVGDSDNIKSEVEEDLAALKSNKTDEPKSTEPEPEIKEETAVEEKPKPKRTARKPRTATTAKKEPAKKKPAAEEKPKTTTKRKAPTSTAKPKATTRKPKTTAKKVDEKVTKSKTTRKPKEEK